MELRAYEILRRSTSQLVRQNQKIYKQEKEIIQEVLKAINEDECIFDTIDKIIDAGAKLASLEKAKNDNNKKRKKLIKAA